MRRGECEEWQAWLVVTNFESDSLTVWLYSSWLCLQAETGHHQAQA